MRDFEPVMSTEITLQPKELQNYSRLDDSDTSSSDIVIPATAQNRQKTDKYFFLVFIGCVVLLIPFLIYTLYYSDIRRFNGYDNCGNVCGAKNFEYDQWNCTGKDMTHKPIYSNGTCTPVTPKYYSDNNKTEDEFGAERLFIRYGEDRKPDQYNMNGYTYVIGKVGWKIALSSFLSLGYCIITVILLRYATKLLVWGFLILPWICLLLCMLFLREFAGSYGNVSVIVLVTFFSIIELILLFIMISLRKRIRLVVMLFKESLKALSDMTLIFFVPAMMISGVTIITITCTISMILMYTSGILIETADGNLKYVWDAWMLVTIIFNVIMVYWAIQFVGGIQHMVISGAVSKWYFTKNKKLLGSPILTSALIAFKFHLGTVALGSSVIALATVLRFMLGILDRILRSQMTLDCSDYLEPLLKFFTRSSYIFTAMYGTPFFQSGKQLVKHIELNICYTLAVSYIGDFALGMARILIISLSLLTTYALLLEDTDYRLWSNMIVLCFTTICSHYILGIFQTAVHTLMLCLREDCLINDGVKKPYAMSRGFMEFAENSKKLFAVMIHEKVLLINMNTLQAPDNRY